METKSEILDFLDTLVKALVDDKTQVSTKLIHDENRKLIFSIQTAALDMPRLIGVEGKNIKAIKCLMNCLGTKNKYKINVVVT